ncbi:MAG TPA: type III secretion system export apparatus subunit SctT [Pararobbsia sp.]|nr:type III secretion system export apparatus subunit SctT [Pararobbsia sp.]
MQDSAQWVQALWNAYGPALKQTMIAYARVAPVCLLLPFLNDRVVSGMVLRQSLVLLIAFALRPTVEALALPFPQDWVGLACVLAREVAIGTSIGVTLALPFWICMGVGELIDNQRGATLSEVLDPAHGVEVSTFAAFMSIYAIAVFLANDGMRVVLDALYRSYAEFDRPGHSGFDWLSYGRFLDMVSREALRLSAPVVGAMFVTEVLLGALSRFATQMGVFSLAFSIKSLVAFVVFFLYFGPSLEQLFDTTARVLAGGASSR